MMPSTQYVTLTAEHEGHTYEAEFKVNAGTPAQTYGDPDDCYPAEGPVIGLVCVRTLDNDALRYTCDDLDADTFDKLFPDEDVLAVAQREAEDEAWDNRGRRRRARQW